MKSIHTDIAIIGGGIAGLWLLTRIRSLGYRALLLEANALGSGQTIHSQGIIHGGLKYALQGKMTQDASNMASLPSTWLASLQGQGDVDLRSAVMLSPHQYLWSNSRFKTAITTFFASKALQSHVSRVDRSAWPAHFQTPHFKGELFALHEPVLSIPSVLEALANANPHVILQTDPITDASLVFDSDHRIQSIQSTLHNQALTIHPKQVIWMAGSGNEAILTPKARVNVATQRRPLHMVFAKIPNATPLYAHCLGFDTRPLITITSHVTSTQEIVWYLGGMLAEEGVAYDHATQITNAKKCLAKLFPWISLQDAEFACVRIDRAEEKCLDGKKPEGISWHKQQNCIVAWPTKLAFAPTLTSVIQDEIQKELQPSSFTSDELAQLQNWPRPRIATPPWETVFCYQNAF